MFAINDNIGGNQKAGKCLVFQKSTTFSSKKRKKMHRFSCLVNKFLGIADLFGLFKLLKLFAHHVVLYTSWRYFGPPIFGFLLFGFSIFP